MKLWLRLLLLACFAAFASTAASAQNYPSKPVKIVVPFGAGGPADVFARVLAQYLGEELRQSFVVEDRPGAGAVIGTEAVAKSAPDGYTLLLMSNTHTTNESLLSNKPYQLMRDFVAISPINYSDLLMVVHPSVGVHDVKGLIALAKAKPGVLNYASSGPGTPYHMAAELFKAMTQTDIVHVPFKSSGDMRSSVIGGHVQMMFDAITVIAEAVRSGQLVALGTTGSKRSEIIPDTPTVAEAGVPGYEATIWLGLMAPAGTPASVVDLLNAEVKKVVTRRDVKETWAKQGAVPMLMSPAEFTEFLRADINKWAQVIRASGAHAQ